MEGTVDASSIETPQIEEIHEEPSIPLQSCLTNVNHEKIPSCEKVEKTSSAKRLRDDKHRKKDDKSVEHVLRALNSLNTPEEKLAAMCKKYADLVNEHRAIQNVARQGEKRISILQREKEQLQGEHSKSVLVRSRLENLCRELQKQNKIIKDETCKQIREEEERRKEISAKFQTTLSEITSMMKQNSDKSSQLRDDNIDMTAKLKSLCQEFEKREMQMEKLVKQFQLEVQLADTKLAKAKIEMSAERESLLKEKQLLLMEVEEYKAKLEQMQESEVTLRKQMTVYNEKYDDFHTALTQSNQVIAGFKTEMDKMSKQIRKLEKETCIWKTKYDESHSTLLRMTEDKVREEEELIKANKRVTTLQNLCRTLQDQVIQFRNQQKGAGGTCTVIPANQTVTTKKAAGDDTTPHINGEVNDDKLNSSTPSVCSCDIAAVSHKMSQADLT